MSAWCNQYDPLPPSFVTTKAKTQGLEPLHLWPIPFGGGNYYSPDNVSHLGRAVGTHLTIAYSRVLAPKLR